MWVCFHLPPRPKSQGEILVHFSQGASISFFLKKKSLMPPPPFSYAIIYYVITETISFKKAIFEDLLKTFFEAF